MPRQRVTEDESLARFIETAVRHRRTRARSASKAPRQTRRPANRAETDPLTGLLSRRWFDRSFGRGRLAWGRRGGLSVAVVDVDHLRDIQDSYGPACGDAVLRRVADLLRHHTRRGDLVFRWGDEEFLAVRPLSSRGEMIIWARDLRDRIATLTVGSSEDGNHVTASIGVVSRSRAVLDSEAIWQADQAMCLARQLGRNRVCTWEMVAFDRAVEATRTTASRSLEARLREALSNCETHLGPTQRDHLTSHAAYVSKMAMRIGRVLGVDGPSLERLRLAGLCHDLGKLLIPEEVLAKPEALSDEERTLVSSHPADGADLCLRLGADAETADYVRYHHVRYNGGGVRGGLRGEGIPRGARVLAVADAFVTMTSNRPYCRPRSYTATLRELQRKAGDQFDPLVIQAIPAALAAEVPL